VSVGRPFSPSSPCFYLPFRVLPVPFSLQEAHHSNLLLPLFQRVPNSCLHLGRAPPPSPTSNHPLVLERHASFQHQDRQSLRSSHQLCLLRILPTITHGRSSRRSRSSRSSARLLDCLSRRGFSFYVLVVSRRESLSSDRESMGCSYSGELRAFFYHSYMHVPCFIFSRS